MNALRSFTSLVLCGAVPFLSACSSNPESVATKKCMEELKLRNNYAMFGHIARQGRYTLDDASPHLTVSQAVLRAGGYGPYADKKHVVLRRGSDNLEQRLLINLDAIMRKTDANEDDPTVKAGDVIIVYDFLVFSKL